MTGRDFMQPSSPAPCSKLGPFPTRDEMRENVWIIFFKRERSVNL